MASHSILPPSSAGIWGKPDGCPGWVTMALMYPELEDSPEAAEGTAAHELAAEAVELASRAQPLTTGVGDIAPNGVAYTEEMVEAAQDYAAHIQQIMRDAAVFGGPNLGIERKIHAPQVHADSWGTVDFFLYDHNQGVLYVYDYKFGHRHVDAFENYQLINYYAGIISELGIDGHADQHLTVEFGIFQPRAYKATGAWDFWRVTGSDLRGHINALTWGASQALGLDPSTKSGLHCRDCTARHACEAALRGGASLYHVAAKPVPAELDPQALGLQLKLVREAESMLGYLREGYEAQVEALTRQGKAVPGWAQQPKMGRKRWANVADAITIADACEVDIRKHDAVTPNQAIKLGLPEEIVASMIETPQVGISIVPDNGTQAKKVFT